MRVNEVSLEAVAVLLDSRLQHLVRRCFAMSELYQISSKVCTSCHIDKPFTCFTKGRGKYNLKPKCRECIAKHGKAQRIEARQKRIAEKQLLPLPTSKTCTHCEIEKSLTEFSKSSYSDTTYQSWCKKCMRGNSHRHYIANRDALNKRHKEYYETHRKECISVNSAYYFAHSEQAKLIRRNYWRAYYERNRERYYAKVSRRNALKKNVTVDKVNYQQILERDGMWCYICESDILPHHKIQFDHVIPLARKGPHSNENIKVTHDVCNHRKHTRLLEEMTPFQRRGINEHN